MPRFQHYDYRQHILLSVNLEEQLQPGTFEHALHYLIDNKIDLSVFHEHYSNDVTGRHAYDPALLLKIVLFAYYKRSDPAGILNGVVTPTSCLKHFPVIWCRTGQLSPTLSPAIPMR